MKYVFAILLGIHGLIHLTGFIRAFYATDVNQQLLGISKPAGALWLIVFIMFIVSAIQYITHKHWFYIGFLAIILSQILIVITWKDAKYGTLLNIIILIAVIISYSTYRFNQNADLAAKTLFAHAKTSSITVINDSNIRHLPVPVQRWLKHSGVIGQERVSTVRLKQKGTMRTKPESQWMPFKAVQYFDVSKASFIWKTKVNLTSLVQMQGCDKLLGGEGEMLIKLAGFIPMVNQRKTPKINSGAMTRYLSEICWNPSAALEPYITWEAIDEVSARATFDLKEESVSGVFTFSPEGDIQSFSAMRYFGGSNDATLEKWTIHMLSHASFNGISVPNKSKVVWQLQEGDFHWLDLEVTVLEYNTKQIYQ
ncbi:DUF6544 family protein [uncultured Psychroserpens sp.]|uniref:DUF6920 family protein n=1 Tax=uncultured Psychroserpens sp. TaxID=255436 RepID=UPI0026237C67|nr:DUF6544 family protein [uncultured Psychroserpens sp.]